MGKRYFIKCFGCWSGYDCGKTPRLARKKKKQLKKYLESNHCFNSHFMDVTSKCNIVSEYKRYKGQFFITDFVKRYKSELEVIAKYCENSGEQMYIDDKGRLCWYWEYDGDYGGDSGIMPFCYSKEDAGETWAFSEVQSLVRFVQDYPDEFVFPVEVNSDKQLLKYIGSFKK